MDTFTYRLNHDLGFAPNPFFGWCTLACCMSKIREHAGLGDIIIGMAGSDERKGLGRIHPQLIYWMQVEETLTFDEYWSDSRFVRKMPEIRGPKFKVVGDRTYRHDPLTGEWKFEVSMHYIPGAPQKNGGYVRKDTKRDRLLLSRRFTYWGKSGPELPDRLITLFPTRQGHRRHGLDEENIEELHRILDINNPRGMVGEPADWDNPRYFREG